LQQDEKGEAGGGKGGGWGRERAAYVLRSSKLPEATTHSAKYLRIMKQKQYIEN